MVMALHNLWQLFHFLCGKEFIQAVILHFSISHFVQQTVYFSIKF